MTIVDNKQENSKSYSLEDWQKGYDSQPNEYEYLIDNIEGEIPKDLEGTLYRNGPSLFDINDDRVNHPFDGDGMISAFTFKDGKCHFQNRFVRTKGYENEQNAGKILYRGFGTQKSGGWLNNIFDIKPKNVANTGVLSWGNKLLAMWEGGLPHSLHKSSLETIKLDNLNGILTENNTFSAHPRIINSADGKEKILVNFGVKSNLGLSSEITIFEIDNQWNLLSKKIQNLPGFHFLHDIAVTPNYYLFFQNPLYFKPLPFLLGFSTPSQCLKFNPQLPTRIILIPRKNKGEMQFFETDCFCVFHHANAWEDNDSVYLESVCYKSFPSLNAKEDFRTTNLANFFKGELRQFKLNLVEKSVTSKVTESHNCEFPTINTNYTGYSYRYLYLGITQNKHEKAPLQKTMKVDWQTGEKQIWNPGYRCFAGEPIFVAFPNAKNEDDGWLLVLVYDASIHKSYLAILDARNLTKKPLTKLHLNNHIPHGFHGTWQG